MAEALAQAKRARFEILDVIEATISEPRPNLAPSAPKIDTIKIDADKIKVVIGKGGETIDKIIEETGVKIDIDEDGLCSIFSPDQTAINRAKEIITELVREAKVGDVYEAKVVRIEKSGAFVHLFGHTDAMVHISELAWNRTNKVEDALKLGDVVKVKITKVDDKGRVDASVRALLEKPEGYEEPEHKPRERRNGKNGNGHRGYHKEKTSGPKFERRERKASVIDEEFPELSTTRPE